ncbi:uncharacterized protein LOC130891150 [Diorhabda carinulata]|uniref:uncharacterized protein LOC130891150 n=1 Tax=Diorhabda carinulata TaxID=1163345 RepID=UPI0025A069CF|nr:uncharacterized protein LOC130891150 [Diorhabda carinulata]
MASVVTKFSEFLNSVVSPSTSVDAPSGISVQGRRIISLDEVSWHDKSEDCWVIIYDRVYNVTDFLDEHPGGSEVLLEYGGREASGVFRDSGHSDEALKSLEKYCIGELPVHERIFRKPGRLQLRNVQ